MATDVEHLRPSQFHGGPDVEKMAEVEEKLRPESIIRLLIRENYEGRRLKVCDPLIIRQARRPNEDRRI